MKCGNTVKYQKDNRRKQKFKKCPVAILLGK